MSGLTEEQKKKIEESRRKALAIRAAKAKQNATQTNGIHSVKSATSTPNSTSISKKQPSVSGWLGLKQSAGSQNAKMAATQNSTSTRTCSAAQFFNSTKTKQSSCQGISSKFSPSKYDGKGRALSYNKRNRSTTVSPVKSGFSRNLTTVKGKCVLVSRERFMVDVGYCTPLVAVFKNIPTKQYDMITKKWSFELRDYHDLMNSIKHLSDTVLIEPLPRCVLSTFDKVIRGQPQPRDIPEADLSKIDPQLVNYLFPYQREGVNFAIYHNGRVLMADDMGLGKTIQALCIAAFYRSEWPLLIVVPSSVRFAWREQILRWLPSVSPDDIDVVVSSKENNISGNVVIISYDLMVRKQTELDKRGYKVIIMDESHFLKNKKTARTQTAIPLLKKARRILLLSGTPALSRPSELFVQLSAVDSQLFPRFHEFGLRYCDGKQMPWGWDFTGSSNLAELQLVLEERLMIRRLKRDVLDQLPAKIRQMVVLDPGSVKIRKSMKVSHKFINRAKGSDRHSALLEYFHETGTAKKQAVREYIMDHLEAGNKILVFAHHQEVLDAIEEAVTEKYRYIRIDGRTAAERRSELCDEFQTQDEVRVAILSICAANAGLNLMAASLVIFAELFWNPGILVQAEDRAHRIGQQDSVNIHYLVATGTADDFIWPLVQAKLEVLSKAGLSKEDFTEAHTTHFKDPRQKDILHYFEESFFDDSFTFDESEATHSSFSTREEASGDDSEKRLKIPSDDQTPESKSLTVSSEETGFVEAIPSDWLDDETFQDIDESELDSNDPPVKKMKTR